MIYDEIYLDHAAATPMADFVVEAMQPYFSEFFYNPSSPYAPAVKVRREYEVAKQQLAETFGAKGDEVVITAGATESINLVFSAIAGHVVTSKIEHPAVLESAKRRDHTLVEVSEKGMVSPEAIRQAVRPDTSLVSIAFANNELGTLQPIRRIAQMIETERRNRAEQGNMTPLLFHCDASQGFDQMDIHVARLGVDLLTLNAGKVYGPKQVGLLWTKRSAHLEPYIVGGGQERGLRSGTENVAGTIGFAVAAHRASEMRRSEGARLRDLRDLLQGQLTDAFPESVVLGSQKHRLPGHLSMAFPMIDAERIIFLLEARGIYVATGSACSANKHTASHVLRAIGIDEALINGSLRFTLGRHTTKEQILLAAEGIIQAVSNEYQRMERTA
ncbi:MAG TPA: cysteine desulfurase family protein [Candidatus Saccharimonadales bacterium]